jgi:hypothetical protein
VLLSDLDSTAVTSLQGAIVTSASEVTFVPEVYFSAPQFTQAVSANAAANLRSSRPLFSVEGSSDVITAAFTVRAPIQVFMDAMAAANISSFSSSVPSAADLAAVFSSRLFMGSGSAITNMLASLIAADPALSSVIRNISVTTPPVVSATYPTTQPTLAPTTAGQSSGSPTLSMGAIVGIAIGGAAALGLIGVCVIPQHRATKAEEDKDCKISKGAVLDINDVDLELGRPPIPPAKPLRPVSASPTPIHCVVATSLATRAGSASPAYSNMSMSPVPRGGSASPGMSSLSPSPVQSPTVSLGPREPTPSLESQGISSPCCASQSDASPGFRRLGASSPNTIPSPTILKEFSGDEMDDFYSDDDDEDASADQN